MSIIEEKWEEIIDLLCTDYSVSYLSYQTWLKPMKVKDFHGNTLTISTGKEEGVAFISRKYRKQIEPVLNAMLFSNLKEGLKTGPSQVIKLSIR